VGCSFWNLNWCEAEEQEAKGKTSTQSAFNLYLMMVKWWHLEKMIGVVTPSSRVQFLEIETWCSLYGCLWCVVLAFFENSKCHFFSSEDEKMFLKNISTWLVVRGLWSSHPTLQVSDSLKIAPNSRKGCHTSFTQNGSPLAPLFSCQFLWLHRIPLLRRGVTTPNIWATM